MSNMLEQAIIDAAALREAALKNAERSVIEKYAPQIKKAVAEMLDGTIKETKIYQGRTVEVVHEADEQGNVTVQEAEGKPFIVNEAELSEASENDVIQEEEMAAAMDTTTPPADIAAPPAWDSRYGETESVTLSAMLDNVDGNGDIEIDLDAIELSLAQQQEAEMAIEEPVDDLLASPEEEEGLGDLGGEEEELDLGLDDLGGEEDLQLQEIVNAISDMLDEEMNVDMRATKGGTIDTALGELQYEADKQEARDAHHDEDEEEDDSKKEEDKSSELQETINVLKQQNKKLENIVYKLNNKLEETLLSNAKLLYQNRTLNDASLNERQKSKIVEAIGNAESPKEARSLQETLKATVGSDRKRGPQSLSESVNRRSNLSSMLNRRQNVNESQSSDPFFAKMQKLAGIKKQ